MKINKLVYLQKWHYEGFQLEVPINTSQLNDLGDIHLVPGKTKKSDVLALLAFKEGHTVSLNHKHINAHCYTLCPTLGEMNHVTEKTNNKTFKGRCYPSSQTVFIEQLPDKKARMNIGGLFIHYFKCALVDVYQHLCHENPAMNIFKFKHCSVISELAPKNSKAISMRKNHGFF